VIRRKSDRRRKKEENGEENIWSFTLREEYRLHIEGV
jgi:hypothetical protein